MRKSNRRLRWLASVAFCLTGLAGLGEAAEIESSEQFARNVLERMSRYVAGAEGLAFAATAVNVDVPKDGLPTRMSTRIRVAVRRPGQLYAEIESGEVHRRITSNGREVRLADLLANVYAVAQAPGGIDATLDYLGEDLGVFVPLSELLRSNPVDGIMEGVLDLDYVGLDDVDGVRCHQLSARQADLSWEVWIEDGPRPLPLKLAFHFWTDEGSSTFTAQLSGLALGGHLPDETFEPSRASDAREVPLRMVTESR